MKNGSIKNWNPGEGKARDEAKRAKLFSTEGSDGKDTMTGTNTLKEWVGGKGVPSGPFGKKAKEF